MELVAFTPTQWAPVFRMGGDGSNGLRGIRTVFPRGARVGGFATTLGLDTTTKGRRTMRCTERWPRAAAWQFARLGRAAIGELIVRFTRRKESDQPIQDIYGCA